MNKEDGAENAVAVRSLSVVAHLVAVLHLALVTRI